MNRSRQLTSNNTFCLYFLKEVLLAHFQRLLGRRNRDAFFQNEGKIHEGGYVVKVFFVSLQVGTLHLHYE